MSGQTRPQRKPTPLRLFSDSVRERMQEDVGFRDEMFCAAARDMEAAFREVRNALVLFNLSTEDLAAIQAVHGRLRGALRDIECQSNDLTAVEVAREALVQ